ncbi:MAG: 4-hydroxy-tetrahydrodipicolinate reductase [Verrucomicrobiota bacterium]|nr:4-hydroxy-tetrahydrodipicolinate reductase [Verrucomicrobiota bacterium]|tara:strand:- start:536 stop:1270 length:735 start_codon:yes stop_codon:yes gene_type:complete
MTKVIINGSKGRMGQALNDCADVNPDIEITAGIDVGDNLADVISDADVVIEFSFHEITRDVAKLCAKNKKALVIGTTGHSAEDKDAIIKLKSEIPIVWASNFSTGVNTLFWLTRKATQVLGADFDLEVIEMHHRLKKDSPSGTAATLSEILAEVRKVSLEKEIRHGRQGIVGERTDSEIGMHSLRGGDVVGDHTVVYAGNGERLELSHKAASRNTFANGALRAAIWACGQSPGLYNMEDVLGLE